MSKGSGGTRVKGPASKEIRSWKDAYDAPQDKLIDFVVSHIKNVNNDLQPDTDAVLSFDKLSDDSIDKVLERLNFTGVVDNEQIYGGNGFISTYQVSNDRRSFFNYIDDATWNNEPDDNLFFVVQYNDGSRVDSRDFTKKTKMKRTGVVWAMGGGEWDGYMYAPKSADFMPSLNTWGNFSEWKNGKKIR